MKKKQKKQKGGSLFPFVGGLLAIMAITATIAMHKGAAPEQRAGRKGFDFFSLLAAQPPTAAPDTDTVAPPIPAPAAPVDCNLATIVTAEGFNAVNVRATPSSAAPITGVVMTGKSVCVLNQSTAADWIQISSQDGLAGWVVSAAVRKVIAAG